MSDLDSPNPHDSVLASGLYVVATPIGHLDDLTLRAAHVLRSAHTVIAEDTRVTQVLLRHIGANPKLLFAAHNHNEQSTTPKVMALLAAGQSVALVSDAGTPGISDPGAIIVAAARQSNYPVITIPGASAVVSLISISGDSDGRFWFEGFLPHSRSGRVKRLNQLKSGLGRFVLYESPHRIADCLTDVLTVFGSTAQVRLGRELTKRFEESFVGNINEAIEWVGANPNRCKGEYVLSIFDSIQEEPADQKEVIALLTMLLPEVGTNTATKIAASFFNLNKESIYKLALTCKNRLDDSPVT